MQIVIVEDDPQISLEIEEILADQIGCLTFIRCCSKSEFIQRLQSLAQDPPYAVVVDSYLPEVLGKDRPDSHGGINCVEAMRKVSSLKDTPVILTSEFLGSGGNLTHLGPTEYLPKMQLTTLPKSLVTMTGDHSLLGTGKRNRRVFIVHGRNEEMLHKVKSFLYELEVKPVVLNREPGKGDPIIVKLARFTDIKAAVVLLTGDDRGGLQGTNAKQLKSRARQNVIVELGYFFGCLGRDQVVIMADPAVERPSDIDGLVYIELDRNGGWQAELAKELKTAGVPVKFL